MNVLYRASIGDAISKYSPDVFIHCAAVVTDTDGASALEVNIVGTVNVVLACQTFNVKLIYISTDQVYPESTASHFENAPVLPWTRYAWTKLGGECAVRTYENSLIVRGALCPRPYPHQQAYTDVRKNMIYQDTAAEFILRLLDTSGVVNLGESRARSLYEFAKDTRPDVRPETSPAEYRPKYSCLSTEKLKRSLSS